MEQGRTGPAREPGQKPEWVIPTLQPLEGGAAIGQHCDRLWPWADLSKPAGGF